MRLAVATLLPLLILGGAELALRLVGYGYRTSYFLPSTIDGQKFLLPNPRFSYRFFPPALARAPLPKRIPAEKPADTYRIFLFGESAAYGDPDPAYGVGRFLEQLLNARFPGTDFEVVCVAMTAINSHAILPIARQCARLDGDLWIVYMGNNEMIGAYGPGTVFGARAPRLRTVRVMLALKTTRLGQLMQSLLARVQSASASPEEWGGIEMFTENPLRHDDAGRLRAYENFKGNLADMLRVGEEAGVPVLLSTVASNLRDCAPFVSLHAADLTPAERSEWQRFFQAGLAAEAAGSTSNALAAYSNAAAIDAEYAELHYRIGACHLALNNLEAAYEAFVAARDYDALSVRADSRINQIILDAAESSTSERVLAVDAALALAEDSPDGMVGKEWFYEHVHYNLEGNDRLARLFADHVTELLPASIRGASERDWADADFCKRRLAVTSWDEHRLWFLMLDRLKRPPFTNQSSNPSNAEFLDSRRQDVIARMAPESPALDRQLYKEALALAPEDNLIFARFGQYLEATGSRQEAIVQFQRVCELLPDLDWPYYHLGDLLARAGRNREAIEAFERALAIRRDFREAREELRRLQARR